MSDYEDKSRAARQAEEAILRWLRGEVQHVQCVTTERGKRLVLEWERSTNSDTPDHANE